MSKLTAAARMTHPMSGLALGPCLNGRGSEIGGSPLERLDGMTFMAETQLLQTIRETIMNTTMTSASLRRVIATAIMSAWVSGGAAVCAAADRLEKLQVTVKYGDLNVSNPQGAATLYARIRAAASEVCRPLDRRGYGPETSLRVCMRKAIADAVAKVNQPALSALYSAQNGTSQPIIVATGHSR